MHGLKDTHRRPVADTIYGSVDASGDVWGVVFVIDNFSGPGTYTIGSIKSRCTARTLESVEQPRRRQGHVYDRSQPAGRNGDATLTNATSAKVAAQHITGRWNCRG